MSFTDYSKLSPEGLLDQTVLITGAGGRLGSEVAKQALSLGAKVVLADISPASLDNVCSAFPSSSLHNVHTIIVDTSNSSGIDHLISTASDSVGCIDSAVHCAYPRSKGWGAKFEDIQDENLFSDLNMQLGGAILFSQKLLRFFKDQGHGNLIHLSSIQGISAPKFEHYVGTSMTSPIEYAAIKAGIISIVKWLAKYSANQISS